MGESSGREICRILLVDDHKLLMEGVRSLLAPHAHLRVAGMALSGGEAVALAASLAPQIVIMDLGMPGMNGVDASRAVLQVQPQARILIYTGHEDQRFLPELIDLGIMGHVRKSESPGVLLKAIESLRRGEIFLTCPDPGGCLAELVRFPRARKRFSVSWPTAKASKALPRISASAPKPWKPTSTTCLPNCRPVPWATSSKSPSGTVWCGFEPAHFALASAFAAARA